MAAEGTSSDKEKKMVLDIYHDEGISLIASHNLTNEWHKHICLQLSLSMHSQALQLDTEDGSIYAHGLIITSNYSHRLHTDNQCCLTLLIDLFHPEAHRLQHLVESAPYKTLNLHQTDRLIPLLTRALADRAPLAIAQIANILASSDECYCKPDNRIYKTTLLLDRLEIKKISSRDVAELVCLSEGRFLHLFKSKVGTNFRRYLLWKRLQDAIKGVASKTSLTDIANRTGFSDSAHFSRTCKEMYGLAPSTIRLACVDDEKKANNDEVSCTLCN